MEYAVKIKDVRLDDANKALAKRLGISERFLSLLLSRGIGADEVEQYLHPSFEQLGSPFDIDGMREASDRLRRAIDGKERVLIYGDYDCDGICAVSILTLFLRDKTDVTYFIPDRNKDGYGISRSALERAFAAGKPSLVITVDCGITAVSETEYIKSLGIDVIVTDHHEPQEQIPDCIVVDPKLDRRGFYELCGAGVALKLVEAMSSRQEAQKYFDIAAIATIADVVPLVSDNRVIAYFGLKQITNSPRKGIKMLLGQESVSSQDVMFRLAPRMNAAGRLGSAMKVIGLFTESDYFMLKTLSEELARDNSRRQDMCEVVVEEAKSMLKGADFNDLGIIALYGENWEAGVIGIAAARLVEEFKRPAVLFAKNGDELKGSARSVPGVNIFELFSNLNDYFTTFGGHAQAAGVGMKLENFEAFRQAANRLILSEHPAKDFIPPIACEMELDKNSDCIAFAKELELMEPTGYGNARPTFLMRDVSCNFERIGFTQHVKCADKRLDILGFSRFYEALGYNSGKMDMEVTLSLNVFQNNVTAQAGLRSFRLKEVALSDDDAACMNVHGLALEGKADIEGIDADKIVELLSKPFGTLIVCFCKADIDRVTGLCKEAASLPVYVGGMPALNPENAIVLCPGSLFDYGYYQNIIIAGDPISEGLIAHMGKRVYALEGLSVAPPAISDATLRAIFRELAALSKSVDRAGSMRKIYMALRSRYKVSEQTFLIAMRIFDELGIAAVSDRGRISVSRSPVRLADSATYRNIRHADA